MPKREVFRTTASGKHPEFDQPKGTLLGAFQQFLGIFGPQGLVSNLQSGVAGLTGLAPSDPVFKKSMFKHRAFTGTGPSLFASRSGAPSSDRGITERERALLQQFQGDPFGRRTNFRAPGSRVTIRS